MEIPEIESLTRATIPAWRDAGELAIDVLDRNGSGRRFFRIQQGQVPDSTLFAMHYSLERRENGRFVEITGFLESLGVPVPGILASDPERQVIWQEDAGSADLSSFQHEDWSKIRAPLYRAALKAVLPLHCFQKDGGVGTPELEPPFDEALYQWEQEYFFEHFAAHFSAASREEIAEAKESQDLRSLVESLSAEPRRLLHRDFQSSNVIVGDGCIALVDYQGLRWGVPEYDLASLLYDPYVEMTPEQRDEMVRYYHELRCEAGDGETWEELRSRLDRCAVQRLMQALGAYGNLGINKGQTEFLRHIPVAAERLHRIAVERGAAPALAPVLSLSESRVA